MTWGPKRIVCLSTESVDMLYRLGVEDQVVGVSGYTVFPPEARKKPFVSGYTSIRYDRIESLNPDLIIAFSDLQADAARELTRRGYSVVLTNQRTLDEMLETLVMLGRIVGKQFEAESLAEELRGEIDDFSSAAKRLRHRPKVFFEEWDDPLITAIAWVGELIEAAGGQNIFRQLSNHPTATQRVVQEKMVVQQQPDIVIASWCGKKANLDKIRRRPGWETIPAVRNRQVFEIKSAHCLQPGPSLISEGLPRISRIIQQWPGPNDA